MQLQSWIKQHLFLTSISIAFTVVLIFFLLWYLFPELVYDQFIWKYFWGPILSDGLDKPVTYHGINAAPKFTLVSEIVYGIVVAGALYGIYRLLKKWDIMLDFSFFLGLLPFILYGSFARALEDTQLFTEPLVFWFVTPLIYIQALILTLLALFLAVYLHKVLNMSTWSVPRIMGCIGSLILLPFLYYIFL